MKLLNILSSALLATAVTARSTIHKRDDTNLSVPGENPLQHCKDPKDDILAIKKVDLDPNPPRAGTKLSITATGILAEDVEEGAKVHLQVKYGLITIIRQEADLCDTVKKVDLECPLKKGDLTLTKEVDLPREIPPGNYGVEANVVDKNGKDITCLKATVQFSRGGVMGTGLFKEGL